MPDVRLKLGDCLVRLAEMTDASVGAVIVDPPYGLAYLGQSWDKVGFSWHLCWLKEAHRVLCANGLVKVFGATRTYHRVAQAMEQAGFEIQGLESWCYASGMPKSLDLSKAVDAQITFGRSNSTALTKSELQRPRVGTVRRLISQNRTKENQGQHGVKAYWERFNDFAPSDVPVTVSLTDEGRRFEGYGTSLRPAWEPFVVGRKHGYETK